MGQLQERRARGSGSLACRRWPVSTLTSLWLAVLLHAALPAAAAAPKITAATPDAGPVIPLRQDFADPPPRYWPRPLWFWNNTRVTIPTVQDQMRLARDRCRYGGFGILPFGKEFRPAYLSEEYFAVLAASALRRPIARVQHLLRQAERDAAERRRPRG